MTLTIKMETATWLFSDRDLKDHGYQKNTKELEDVAYMLYESGGIKQTVPLNAKLLNSKLQIQMQNLEYRLKSLKLKLEEFMKVKGENQIQEE